MLSSLHKILHSYTLTLVAAIIIPIVVSLQNYAMGVNHFWGGDYTHYNNYMIFKYAFVHLLDGQNLYAYHLEHHGDFFKYSPSFALFMGLFAFLPDLPGLLLWNVSGSLLLYFALKRLKGITPIKLFCMMLFIAMELYLSTLASQSNVLITALLLLAFQAFENNKPGRAALFIMLGAFIKLFAIAACLLFLFYPNKIKFVLYAVSWALVIALAPLIVVSPAELVMQYKNWGRLLSIDHSGAYGTSLFEIVWVLTGIANRNLILVIGLLLLLLPLINIEARKHYVYRAWYLSAILIWVVVFNHKGESPTYIIPMAGSAVWALYTKHNKFMWIVITCTWLFTSLIKTDVVPAATRHALNLNFITAFMPSLILFIMLTQLLLMKRDAHELK